MYQHHYHSLENDCGEFLSLRLTHSNVDDRRPVPELVKELFGELIGDKGYISQPLFEMLYDGQLQLVTKLKSKMKNRLIPIFDKLLLRKRAIIESVMDQLKNISQAASTAATVVWSTSSSTWWPG